MQIGGQEPNRDTMGFSPPTARVVNVIYHFSFNLHSLRYASLTHLAPHAPFCRAFVFTEENI